MDYHDILPLSSVGGQPSEGRLSVARTEGLMLGTVEDVRSPSASCEIAPQNDKDGSKGGFPQTQGEEKIKVTKADIVKLLENKKLNASERCSAVRKLFGSQIKKHLTLTEIQLLKNNISKLDIRYKEKWRESGHHADRFSEKCKDWLNSSFPLPDDLKATDIAPSPTPETQPTTSSVGRPPVTPGSGSDRTKRKQSTDIVSKLEGQPLELLLQSVQIIAKKEGQRDMAFILRELLKSPNRPSKIRNKLDEKTVVPYSAMEALELILSNNMTQKTYQELINGSQLRGANLYPPYYKVEKEKKTCRPVEPVQSTGTSASVSLQALLFHTTERIIQLQRESIVRYAQLLKKKVINCVFDLSWGFDSSTGNAIYKTFVDTSQNPNISLNSLLVTTVIPLLLASTEENDVLWKNRAPQSVRWCRPLRMQWVKENDSTIKAEKSWVDAQIPTLAIFKLTVEDVEINVSFRLHLTVIDGKVLSIVSGASSHQSCPICRATPKQMNDLSNSQFDKYEDSTLQYGISPLHAWIRCFEFLLHVAYRNVDGLRVWRVKGGEKNPILMEKKFEIQKQMREKLGLRVDFPKEGGAGNSNDGNTARKAFHTNNQSTFAEILGIEKWLIEGLHTILCLISCPVAIDAAKFGEYCKKLAEKYVEKYPWYYMPVTVHKILVHGEAIIKASCLPLGMLSEQAGESRNKEYARFRERNARKDTLQHNLLDVFNRALDTSDPILSDINFSKRQEKCKTLPLPHDALAILAEPDDPSRRQLFSTDQNEVDRNEEEGFGIDEELLYCLTLDVETLFEED